MIRVVHLFDVKRGVDQQSFIEWLDAKLDVAARQFGCDERRTWKLLEGFTGSYLMPHEVRDRPTYVNEAYWTDLDGPRNFRDAVRPSGSRFAHWRSAYRPAPRTRDRPTRCASAAAT